MTRVGPSNQVKHRSRPTSATASDPNAPQHTSDRETSGWRMMWGNLPGTILKRKPGGTEPCAAPGVVSATTQAEITASCTMLHSTKPSGGSKDPVSTACGKPLQGCKEKPRFNYRCRCLPHCMKRPLFHPLRKRGQHATPEAQQLESSVRGPMVRREKGVARLNAQRSLACLGFNGTLQPSSS